MTLRLKNRAAIGCFGPAGRGAERQLQRIAEQAAGLPRQLLVLGTYIPEILRTASISLRRVPCAVGRHCASTVK